nr:choice-of-anchor D domain-containing protein [Terriglobales bacterium]
MLSRFCLTARYSACFLLLLACSLAAHASGPLTIAPLSHDFGGKVVGLKSLPVDIVVTNSGSTKITINNFTIDNPVFQFTQGVAPLDLVPGESTHYNVVFAPAKAQAYSGNFILNCSNGQVLDLPLTGTGKTTNAKATLSTTLLDFGAVTQGQAAPQQSVTITNTGTDSFQLNYVYADAPSTTNFTTFKTILPGGSLSLDVSFEPWLVGKVKSLITLQYDVLPIEIVNLKGTGTAPPSVGVTTYSSLPAATKSAAYSVALAAAGGKVPYTWSLQSGSTLPRGLKGTKAGVISGTLDASVGTGNYSFTMKVTDAAGATSTKVLTLPVDAATGASCSNISWNVPGTSVPIQGLDVLGTGTYLGNEGGLYPSGSNMRPADHTNYGIGLAQAIAPLNADGQPDINGKEVFVVLGESNVHLEGEAIVRDGMNDLQKNPAVVLANGALGDATAAKLSDPNSPFWVSILNYIIPNYGVTPKQVVAAWVEPTDEISSGTFPSDMSKLQSQIENVAQNLLTFFPNIKMVYFSSRAYAGYSNGLSKKINPEPYAFESSYAVKWAVQDQLDGAPNLNFDPGKGPVLAPWMSWGPYDWANGLVVPGPSGLYWSCQDSESDGNHPSGTSGTEKIANRVINF